MKKTYFTGDWHLGDDRIGINGKPNLFYRPFRSIFEQNNVILSNLFNSEFKDGDTLYHLGDVVYDNSILSWQVLESLRNRYPKSTLNLVIGNYDEDKLVDLAKYFDNMERHYEISIGDIPAYLNHYPFTCLKEKRDSSIGITGHIHGLWKVQKSLINVGVDAWHFRPVSENEILFCWNAMQKHYDENVFI